MLGVQLTILLLEVLHRKVLRLVVCTWSVLDKAQQIQRWGRISPSCLHRDSRLIPCLTPPPPRLVSLSLSLSDGIFL